MFGFFVQQNVKWVALASGVTLCARQPATSFEIDNEENVRQTEHLPKRSGLPRGLLALCPRVWLHLRLRTWEREAAAGEGSCRRAGKTWPGNVSRFWRGMPPWQAGRSLTFGLVQVIRIWVLGGINKDVEVFKFRYWSRLPGAPGPTPVLP